MTTRTFNPEDVIEVVVEEEYESGDDDDNLEWVQGEDGNWYCTVEEYEEYDEDDLPEVTAKANSKPSLHQSAPGMGEKRTASQPIVRRQRSSSSGNALSPSSRDSVERARTRVQLGKIGVGTKTIITSSLESNENKFKGPRLISVSSSEVTTRRSLATLNLEPAKSAPLRSVQSDPPSPVVSPKSKRKQKEKRTHRRTGSDAASPPALIVGETKSPLSRLRAGRRTSKERSLKERREKGKSKRLIFGEDLEVVIARDNRVQRHKIHDRPPAVPQVVYTLVEFIRANGLDTPGLFRECGRHSVQQEKEAELDAGADPDSLDLRSMKIHTVSDILKSFFRQLPEPVIPRVPYCSLLIQVTALVDVEQIVSTYRVILQALPKGRFEFLKYMTQFMKEIAAHSAVNLMDANNVAKIFSSLLIGSIEKDAKAQKQSLDSMILLQESIEITKITQLLIEHYDDLFAEPPCEMRLYKAAEPFNSPSFEYISLMRGDVAIILKEKTNSLTVLVNQTVSELPKWALKELKQLKLSQIRVREVAVILGEIVENNKSGGGLARFMSINV